MRPLRSPSLWGLGADKFSMMGAPCTKAADCTKGGMSDTVCCRILGPEQPGICYVPIECVARGAKYDPPVTNGAGGDAEGRRAMIQGATIAIIAIGLFYLTTKSKKAP